MNPDAVLKGFAFCSEAYRQRFGFVDGDAARASAAIWARFLYDVSDDEGLRAFEEHCKTSPFVPTPADIRRVVDHLREDAHWRELTDACMQIAESTGADRAPLARFVEQYRAKRQAEAIARARGLL